MIFDLKNYHMNLNNKIALITGAAQGIGEAIARKFHQENATIILTDIQENKSKLIFSDLKVRAEYQYLDVRNEQNWEDISRHILKKYGKLDILVNNAGITGFLETKGPFDAENVSLDSWNEIHAVNSTGTMLGCKYGIKMMKENGGSIINISSRSGVVGIPMAVAYASSKASIRNHTKSVALYCAEKNYDVRCNSIHPAAIMTPMWDMMLGTGEERLKNEEYIVSEIPLKRFGQAEEVASLAFFLASDESKYITGAEFTIDGGILAGASASPRK